MIEAGDSVLLLFCNQVTDGCETAICQSLNQKRSNDKMIFKAVLICLSKWCAWQCNIFIQLFWTTPQNETIMFFVFTFYLAIVTISGAQYYIEENQECSGMTRYVTNIFQISHDRICHKHISRHATCHMSHVMICHKHISRHAKRRPAWCDMMWRLTRWGGKTNDRLRPEDDKMGGRQGAQPGA